MPAILESCGWGLREVGSGHTLKCTSMKARCILYSIGFPILYTDTNIPLYNIPLYSTIYKHPSIHERDVYCTIQYYCIAAAAGVLQLLQAIPGAGFPPAPGMTFFII